jgi:hypothetical protein
MRSLFGKVGLVLASLMVCSVALAAKPAVIGPDEAYLKWDCVTQMTDGKTIPAGAVSYQVNRRLAAGTWATIATPTGTAAACVGGIVDYLDTKLAKGSYEWNVRAVVATVKSDASANATKDIPGPPPPKPKGPTTLSIEVGTLTAEIRGKLDELQARVAAATPVDIEPTATP